MYGHDLGFDLLLKNKEKKGREGGREEEKNEERREVRREKNPEHQDSRAILEIKGAGGGARRGSRL